MKLTVFLLLVSVAGVLASKSYSQTKMINLNLREATVKEVLISIEEQSGFHFLYSENLINVERKVNVIIENKKIEQVLNLIFEGTNVDYSIRDRFIVLTTPEIHSGELDVLQQLKSISGKVTDSSGAPLPGVSVVVKGTTIGIITDAEGNYSLPSVPSDATLAFSFVGMKMQEIPVNGKSTVNVTMEEETVGIEEVVAIGYGTQNRSTITSAISKVDAKEIRSTSDVNPIKALQGKAAGVDIRVTSGMPGSSPTVIIRGGTSSTPSSDAPLYIIDGVVRPMNNINAEDIASIQVLKDASSTAIYGARGANGIIIITTKGGDKKKGQVTFDYSTQIETLAKSFPFTSAEDYIRVSRTAAAMALDNEVSITRLSSYTAYATGNINSTNHGGGYLNSKYTVEFLDDLIGAEGQELVDDLLNNQGYQTMTDPVTGKKLIFYDNNYDDVMFQTGISNNYNVSFSGGNEKASVYTGLGYTDQKGIVLGTYYDRLSFLVNANYKVRENITVEAGLNFQFSQFKGFAGNDEAFNRSVALPHTCRLYYEDGTPAIGENASSPRSILNEIYYKDYTTKNYETTFRLGVDWELLKGLHFKPSASMYTKEYIYNYFEKYNDFNTTRPMQSAHNLARQFMVDMVLSYDKSFNEMHNLNLMCGNNLTFNDDFGLSGSGSYASTDYISTLNASSTTYQRIYSVLLNERLCSFFGRAVYDFKKKYIFSMSGRLDGSSKFSENNKWAFFPSFSSGWNIHNEEFWKSALINKFKARASWGESGNNNMLLSDTQGEYSTGYDYATVPGMLNTKLANYSLKWETTRSIDFGVDIGLFNDRFTFNADYYDKLTKDKITTVPLSRESGFTSIIANYGSVRNRGFEFEAAYDLIRKGEVRWNIAGNFSFNRLVVVKLPDNGSDKNRVNGGLIYDKKLGDYKMVGGIAEGERVGGIWAFHMLGVYSTDEEAKSAPYDTKVSGTWLLKPASEQKCGGDAIWEDVDSNGQIDDKDLVFMGWAAPDKIGGIVNTVSWKGFTLRFVMDYALGHVICNGWRARRNGNGRNLDMTITDVLSDNMWWEQGDKATIPRYSAVSDYNFGKRNHIRFLDSYKGVAPTEQTYAPPVSRYFKKGDFLAFRELTLSYNLPKNLSHKLFMDNITLDASVYNIGYLTGYDGISPEQYDGGEVGDYYRPRQFKFGIKLSY